MSVDYSTLIFKIVKLAHYKNDAEYGLAVVFPDGKMMLPGKTAIISSDSAETARNVGRRLYELAVDVEHHDAIGRLEV